MFPLWWAERKSFRPSFRVTILPESPDLLRTEERRNLGCKMLSYALLARWKRVPNSAWKVGFAFALASHPVVLLASFQVWIPQLGDLVQSFYRDTLDLFLNGLAKGGVIGPMLQRGCIGAQGVFSGTTSQADVS